MLLEERTYTLAPGRTAAFLDAVERLGLPVMRRVHGGLVGYFVPESGCLNQVVHLWAYEDFADRAARRARLDGDEAWQAYLKVVIPLVEQMETRFLKASGVAPVTLEAIRAANGNGAGA